ncbi:hypothetical protein PVAP13_1NG324200 [Panicum virgatum]|uniref:Uncharacterized protein n=1 Tax=Panicum virgatum TaxID=38727 RepID=A0A8T0X8Y3_PANVG|nr:hypothetical protein PVAP13_1NG324200 [Panicum virgatum]
MEPRISQSRIAPSHHAIDCWTKWAHASQLHEVGEETAGAVLSGSKSVAMTLVIGFSKAYVSLARRAEDPTIQGG